MPEDRFEDEPIEGEELVRSFMVTDGRTRATGVPELPLETLLSLTPNGRAALDDLQFERRVIAAGVDGTVSVAEIAAQCGIPLRAAIVVTSEMTAEGLLSSTAVVEKVDLPMLSKIRDAIAAL